MRSPGAAVGTFFAPRENTPVKLRFQPYTLELRHAFTLATSSRTTTPVMLVEVEKDGTIGYGEASMPPYLGETQETAAAFLSQVDLGQFADPFQLEEILLSIDAIAAGNTAAKAAVDIALHDWIGRKLGVPLYRLWGFNPSRAPVTSFTIGIDTPEVVRQKTREAASYRIIKVKLGRGPESDRMMVDAIRDVTDKPIFVDANQGWRERGESLRMIEWLAGRGVELVEQPMPKERIEDTAWLHERSPLPLIADESVQRLKDITAARGVFHGVNVKLMKCTGLREAHQMIGLARALGLKVMLGCMTETSCAISAAAQLSPMVDWADLDGALLVRNDPFAGVTFVDGRIRLNERPGIGVRRVNEAAEADVQARSGQLGEPAPSPD
jgi:L-alanine-DL-glutamate epimerase-like enolase superfamily enzyme